MLRTFRRLSTMANPNPQYVYKVIPSASVDSR